VPICAADGDGVDELLRVLVPLVPEGPPMYPDDELSDRPLRFLAAEVVREKLMLSLRHELPYSTAVTIEEFIEPEPPAAVRISALIHVERDSQKGIVIGRGGAMLKQVGIAARTDIEALVGRPVMLRLHVRVDPDWAATDGGISRVLEE
jgi:GTP-binding protein Era